MPGKSLENIVSVSTSADLSQKSLKKKVRLNSFLRRCSGITAHYLSAAAAGSLYLSELLKLSFLESSALIAGSVASGYLAKGISAIADKVYNGLLEKQKLSKKYNGSAIKNKRKTRHLGAEKWLIKALAYSSAFIGAGALGLTYFSGNRIEIGAELAKYSSAAAMSYIGFRSLSKLLKFLYPAKDSGSISQQEAKKAETRRSFLKLATKIAIFSSFAFYGTNKALELFSRKQKTPATGKKEKEPGKGLEKSLEWKKIPDKEEQKAAIEAIEHEYNHVLRFSPHEMNSIISSLKNNPLQVTRALIHKWVKIYESKLKPDLESAIRNSKDEIGIIKGIFKKHGVPEKYAFLAIPESHWKNARSPAGAAGIYQFMKGTAKKSGLRITRAFDERLNHYLSAEAAAKNLKSLYNAFKDWNLALAAYNSGMPWDFKRYAKKREIEVTFENYLSKYLPMRLEKELRKKIKRKLKVRKGDTIFSILKRSGITPTKEAINQVLKDNGLRSPKQLKAGQKITISKEAEKIDRLTRRSRFIEENLNYPPKLLAVLEVLEKNYKSYFETTAAPLTDKGVYGLDIITLDRAYERHIVEKGDTLYRIARQYGAKIKDIKRANKIKYARQIRPGQKLRIPLSYSFYDIARNKGVPLESLVKANPHLWPKPNARKLPRRLMRRIGKKPIPYKARVVIPMFRAVYSKN